MANTTFCELREKEILNICDGARLGCICDLEIDDSTGTICSIAVSYTHLTLPTTPYV